MTLIGTLRDTDGSLAKVEARKQTPTGNALNVQIGPGDVISYIPVMIDFDHHQVHEGETFRWSTYVSSLASGNSKDIEIIVPNITIPGGVSPVALCPHFRFEVISSAQADVYLYETPTISVSGTVRTPIAMERNGTYTPKLGIYEDPTVTSVGTQLYRGLILSSKSFSGATENSSVEFVLKNNTKYLLRCTSQSNGNIILMRMVWYEDLGV